MKIAVFLVLSLILAFSVGVPRKALAFDQEDQQSSQQTKFLENLASSRKDGKVMFPGAKRDAKVMNLTLPKPACKQPGDTFCVDPPNYPTEQVEVALRMNKALKYLVTSDVDPEVENKASFQAQETDISLCQSYEMVIYPKAAESAAKEFMFVVNQANFQQGVRIERCKYGVEGNACDYVGDLQGWFTTICKQKFIYRELVAISEAGTVKTELFKFPSSCSCHIKRDAKYFEARMAKKKKAMARRRSEAQDLFY